MKTVIYKQRGVAILVVLILLTLMSLLAVRITGLFIRNTQRASYAFQSQTQQWLLNHEEARLLARLGKKRKTEGDEPPPERSWQRDVTLDGRVWTLQGEVESAQGCFNLNVFAPLAAAGDRLTSQQLQANRAQLITILRADRRWQGQADVFADALLRYFALPSDKEGTDNPQAEKKPRLLLDINIITSAIGAPPVPTEESGPVCLLPSTSSKIDINAVTKEQAPLLAALLSPALNVDSAHLLIAARPEAGWQDLSQFRASWKMLFNDAEIPDALINQFLTTESQFWRSQIQVKNDEMALRVVSNIWLDKKNNAIFTWQHRYLLT